MNLKWIFLENEVLSKQKQYKCNSVNGLNQNDSSSQTSLNKSTPKKVVSMSEMSNSSSSSSSIKSQQIVRSKCACCACKKMFVTRRGDMEILEVDQVASWGSGLLVVTKLINKKNVTKLISYKYIKNIWVNDSEHQTCF
jgi:hypothetical protein